MPNEKSLPAGLWVRLLAFALDYLPIAAYLALLVGIGVAANRVLGAFFGNPVSAEAVGFLLITLPVSLYFALSEASTHQATWGKRRMGLRVTDRAGGRISLARSFARTALKFVPWELAHACIWQISFATDQASPVYMAGFAVVWLLLVANIVSLLASRERQTIYDRLAQTLVVRSAR